MYIFLTKSLPFKGVKKDNDVMMTNANKNNDVIYFHLSSGDFGRSGSHWVKHCLFLNLLNFDYFFSLYVLIFWNSKS